MLSQIANHVYSAFQHRNSPRYGMTQFLMTRSLLYSTLSRRTPDGPVRPRYLRHPCHNIAHTLRTTHLPSVRSPLTHFQMYHKSQCMRVQGTTRSASCFVRRSALAGSALWGWYRSLLTNRNLGLSPTMNTSEDGSDSSKHTVTWETYRSTCNWSTCQIHF